MGIRDTISVYWLIRGLCLVILVILALFSGNARIITGVIITIVIGFPLIVLMERSAGNALKEIKKQKALSKRQRRQQKDSLRL